MEMMRKVDVNAYGHLMGIDCAHWSRHAFSTWPKCDMLKKSSPIYPKIQDKLELTMKQLGITHLRGLVDLSLKCTVRDSSL